MANTLCGGRLSAEHSFQGDCKFCANAGSISPLTVNADDSKLTGCRRTAARSIPEYDGELPILILADFAATGYEWVNYGRNKRRSAKSFEELTKEDRKLLRKEFGRSV